MQYNKQGIKSSIMNFTFILAGITLLILKDIFVPSLQDFGRAIVDKSTRYLHQSMNANKNISARNIIVFQPGIEQGKFRQIQHVVPGRTFGSLILSNEAKQTIVDVGNFLTQKQTTANGIPNRYGIMLYGPPGTGKTQFVISLATTYNVPLYTLTLSSAFLGDESIRTRVFSSFSEKSIVFIDDVDAIFETKLVASGKLSIDTLLSGIDGVYVPHNIVYIIACNNKNLLPRKLTRRFPHAILFDNPNIDSALDLYTSYYSHCTEENKQDFISYFQKISDSEGPLSFSDLESIMKRSATSDQFNDILKDW